MLNLFQDAITPRTRVLFFSHISTFTGVVLPAKELCALARSKGILSAVDGAHVPGMMKLNLHDLGCDLYSSSPHKWLQRRGDRYLYVRDEVIDRVWSTIATEGWDDTKLRAGAFSGSARSNVPMLCGLRAAIELANTIGMDRIERRHRMMGDYLLAGMTQARRPSRWISARSRIALLDRDRECSADPEHGAGELAVEDEENPHPRWSAVEPRYFQHLTM